MSKLEDILQNEVAAEISAIAAEAEAKAKALIEAALAKAEALKASKQRQLEVEHAAQVHRAESAAELLLNQARIAARGQVVDRVKAEARQSLEQLSAQPKFAEILQKLAEEALRSVGKAQAVLAHPDHLPLLSQWAQSRGLELKPDSQIHGGVRVVAEGGRSFVQNVLAERLERAWDSLSAKAVKAIWG